TLEPPPPSPRRGPTGLHRTQFRNSNRKSRKREERKRSEAECLLSRAVGSLGRFQPQAAVSISLMLEQAERLRCERSGYPNLREKGLSKSDAQKLLFIATIRARIAIYARVSTGDKDQDAENQLRQLRQWCAAAGHEIAHEYIDHESGRKGIKERKQFAALFEDAHKRKFDCVLFWALDRFNRQSRAPTSMERPSL